MGSIFGTIIILALIILGALYFWGKRIEETKNAQSMVADNSQPAAVSNDNSEAAMIKSTSQSDDLDSLKTDLENTNTTNLSAEAVAQ